MPARARPSRSLIERVRLPAPSEPQMNMGVFPSGQRGQTVNLLRFASMVRIRPPPRSVANKIDATRKPLESLAVFTFSRVILSFDFHRCHIDTRWIRTTEAVIRGLVSLIFQRSQPSFFVFGSNFQKIYCTILRNLCCVLSQHKITGGDPYSNSLFPGKSSVR